MNAKNASGPKGGGSETKVAERSLATITRSRAVPEGHGSVESSRPRDNNKETAPFASTGPALVFGT
jgi:hypothetical protein